MARVDRSGRVCVMASEGGVVGCGEGAAGEREKEGERVWEKGEF